MKTFVIIIENNETCQLPKDCYRVASVKKLVEDYGMDMDFDSWDALEAFLPPMDSISYQAIPNRGGTTQPLSDDWFLVCKSEISFRNPGLYTIEYQEY